MIFREAWAIHLSDKKVSVAMRLAALIGLLLVSRLAIGQEVFSSGSAPPTYSDEFSGNCHQGQPPNIWVQLGMNPMACRGQVFPQDSNRQCSLRGVQLLGHIGETCYYCSPIKPHSHLPQLTSRFSRDIPATDTRALPAASAS
jgi:hypothetical protein